MLLMASSNEKDNLIPDDILPDENAKPSRRDRSSLRSADNPRTAM